MILGMDFGTTNSGMAVFDGRTLRPIPLDPARSRQSIDRTALYVTHDHNISIGQRAVDLYLEQNVGRPVKMERVRVGTIAVTAADIGTYYRDVHIERDVLSPGRLFTSFKTFLPSTTYDGTLVGGLFYSLEDIVSTYLRVAKLRAERVLGEEVHAVALGRPVTFSRDAGADRLARDRLVVAAYRAGFDAVYLQYEPVAAAFQYEAALTDERIVLIFDFGGGTLDVTIMRLGNPKTREVLAAGGIPVAGDVFDQRIVRLKLARLFGEGSSYGPSSRRVPVPAWIYDALSDWQSIVSLQQPENRAILEDILASSDQPRGIRNLIELASRNYGLTLYSAVEEAKRALSDAPEATIRFTASGFALDETITRREFEALIDQETRAVERLVDTLVRDAGLSRREIDAVVRTGGSSQIPVFVHLLQRMFGANTVRGIDSFSSVTSGLAVAAHRIEQGELDAAPYRRPDQESAITDAVDGRVAAIDPRFLTAWVTAQERNGDASMPGAALTRLTADYRLVATVAPGVETDEGGTDAIAVSTSDSGGLLANQAVLSGLDDRLVLVTSAYRFLLTTPRQLIMLEQSGMGLPRAHGFARTEVVSTLRPWDNLREQRHLAVLTGRGFMWVIDMERLRGRLDRSIPFSLETTNDSDPVVLAGVCQDQHLAIMTSMGRALRIGPQATAWGMQAIKCAKDERVVACLPVRNGDQILLVAPDSAARLIPAERIPVSAAPNSRGAVVAARMNVRSAVVATPASPPWLLTSTCLRRVRRDRLIQSADAPRKPARLATLDADEHVTALVRAPRPEP